MTGESSDENGRKDLGEKARELPAVPGVYLFVDGEGREIYVGKAKNLRKRVRQYFDRSRPHDQKTLDMLAAAVDFTYIECSSETEAFLLENRLIKDLQPQFNIRQKGGMDFPVVEISWGDDFPRVLVTRDRSNPDSRYYGPFTSASLLRKALAVLQPVFKFRTCALKISESDEKLKYYRPCLEYFIDRCKAPCNLRQSKEDYRANMRRLAGALGGRVGELKRELDREMKAASESREYEKAAELRDMLRALDSLDNRGSVADTQITPGWLRIDPAAGCEKLRKALGLEKPVRVIEGIDIAHLQTEAMVGSLVSFLDGVPNKSQYRRYRIKSHNRNDDYASVAEVVGRRYSRLAREGGAMPDVVLIDGGAGQLRAAAHALEEAGLELPCLCSLAKSDEIIFTLYAPGGIKLPRRNEGLRLLQFVRDEAHRFAGHYHHILRQKRIFE